MERGRPARIVLWMKFGSAINHADSSRNMLSRVRTTKRAHMPCAPTVNTCVDVTTRADYPCAIW